MTISSLGEEDGDDDLISDDCDNYDDDSFDDFDDGMLRPTLAAHIWVRRAKVGPKISFFTIFSSLIL